MSLQIITTADGSHTISNTALNVTYHSRHGAINESRHVFIEAGLNYIVKGKKKLSILEVGFGTGLNALLTLIEAEKNDLQILYDVVELHPLDSAFSASLNYLSVLPAPGLAAAFAMMHKCEWNVPVNVTESFLLKKIKEDIQTVMLPGEYDVLYFDAFDPAVQPELWTLKIFRKLYSVMNVGAALVTYSSKGEVRRAMTAAGLSVTKLAGPKGKREITRGLKL